MRLLALSCGYETADFAVFDPLDPRVGTKVHVPYHVYLIDHPKGFVLFDTGAHPSLATDPVVRLGPAAAAFDVHMGPGDGIAERLRSVGVEPGDVAHVVQSHLHYDHAGGIEFLPQASFYVQRRELQFAHWPPAYQRDLYVPADFAHPVHWVELTGKLDLFGDERVVVFPTPGHTPGHQSLLVQLDDEAVILGGDMAYSSVKMQQRRIPGVVWCPDRLVESWERVEALQARHGARLILTHELDPDAVDAVPKPQTDEGSRA
jgi:N-acyl homoserine lactone hydrolase